MKRLFTLIVLLTSATLFAADGATVLLENVNIKIDAEGRVTRHVEQRIQLNTFRTLRSMGEWFHVYNPQLEELNIIQSVTVQPDGTRVPMPDNAMLDQTPYAVQNAPDFSGIRERMVSHTGLEPGCVVEFAYETRDLVPHRMIVVEPMGGYVPIRNKLVTIVFEGQREILVNGQVIRDKNGAYQVQNQPAILENNRFKSPLHTPALVIPLTDPAASLRSRLNSDGTVTETLALMELDEHETDGRILTTLRHLLRDRLDTASVLPTLVNTDREVDTAVASGYASAFEKVRIAHAVLNHFAIDHQVFLVDQTLGDMPLMTDPAFVIMAADCLLWPASIDLENRNMVALAGNAPAPATDIDFSLSVRLEQQNDGFTGTAVLDSRGPLSHPGIHGLLPIPGMQSENAVCLTRTTTHAVETMDVTWTMENGQIQVNTILSDMFHLKDLAQSTTWATDLTLVHPVKAVVDVTILFDQIPDMTVPVGLQSANSLGTAESNWQVDGKTLRIRMAIACNPFHVHADACNAITELLTPLMTPAQYIGFMN